MWAVNIIKYLHIKQTIFVLFVQTLSASAGPLLIFPTVDEGGRFAVVSVEFSLGSPPPFPALTTGEVWWQQYPEVGESECHLHLRVVRLASG